jgi:competence protein ComEC
MTPEATTDARAQSVSEFHATALAVAATAGALVGAAVALRGPVWVAPCTAVVALAARRPWLLVAAVALAACVGSARSWAAIGDVPPRQYIGPAEVVGDPVRRGAVVNAVLRIDGQRFSVWAAGSPGRRLHARSGGDMVLVDGRIGPIGAGQRRRLAVRHVVGELDVANVIDWWPGTPLSRSTNRTRAVLDRGARVMDDVDRALFRGLVLGDDRDEPQVLVAHFRAAGLGHLTAVSGQNIAFVLAAAGPLLRRCRPFARWAVTLLFLTWFCALTRFEPSVLRAGVMAGLAATSFGLGRSASGLRLLSYAVTILVLVDPFLVWSVGFWLSVTATLGMVLFADRIAAALPGPRWLATPVAVSMAAQLGVAPALWIVFGGEPVAALPANVLAEPAAALTMTFGLPAGIVAGFVPRPLAAVLHGPTVMSVRWLRFVAAAAASVDEPGLRPYVAAVHMSAAAALVWRARRSQRAQGYGRPP